MLSIFPVSSITKSCLLAICAVGWLMQSLPALFLYMEGADIVRRKSVPASHLAMPQLLICNRFPFTQAGLNSLGAQFSRDFVLAYLRQWLDPSVGIGPPDDAMASVEQLSAEDRTAAEATIAQLLPNGRLKQRLEQLMPQCQDMVSSCVLRGHQLSGFDCCRMVQPWLVTPRAGICWPFVPNSSASLQSPLDNAHGIQITFQISRNSFHSAGALSVHPGLSVHLMPADLISRLRVATSLDLSRAHSLGDKRSVRLGIRKQIVSNDSPFLLSSVCSDGIRATGAAEDVSSPTLTSSLFSSSSSSSSSSLPQWSSSSATAAHHFVDSANAAAPVGALLCLLEKAIEHCSCVPMIVVLWTLQGDLDSTFLRHFNASTICTVGEFDHCVHRFVEFAMAPAWDVYPTPSDASTELRTAVDTCRKGSTRVCRHEQFTAHSQERELPPEYQNTQDFVSRFSLSFDSFLVTELSSVKEMDIYKLLSTFGQNLWWFAIGHLLWTVCHFRFGRFCPGGDSLASGGAKNTTTSNNKNKVSPKSPMVPTVAAAAATAGATQLAVTIANSTTRTPNANAISDDPTDERHSNGHNSMANALGGSDGPSSPFADQSLKQIGLNHHLLSPPLRPLARDGGARHLPPLTIGDGGTPGEHREREGEIAPTLSHAANGEPPQRRRRGPKLALDELEG